MILLFAGRRTSSNSSYIDSVSVGHYYINNVLD